MSSTAKHVHWCSLDCTQRQSTFLLIQLYELRKRRNDWNTSTQNSVQGKAESWNDKLGFSQNIRYCEEINSVLTPLHVNTKTVSEAVLHKGVKGYQWLHEHAVQVQFLCKLRWLTRAKFSLGEYRNQFYYWPVEEKATVWKQGKNAIQSTLWLSVALFVKVIPAEIILTKKAMDSRLYSCRETNV